MLEVKKMIEKSRIKERMKRSGVECRCSLRGMRKHYFYINFIFAFFLTNVET